MLEATAMPGTTSPDMDRAAAWGHALAQARRAGTIVDLPLGAIASIEEAEAIQIEACEDLEEAYRGYATLCLDPHAPDDPDSFVCAPLARDNLADPTIPFQTPFGLLGRRCALLFTNGLQSPLWEPLSRREAIDAMIRCEYAIELLGRRVPGSVPLDARTASVERLRELVTLHVGGRTLGPSGQTDVTAAGSTSNSRRTVNTRT